MTKNPPMTGEEFRDMIANANNIDPRSRVAAARQAKEVQLRKDQYEEDRLAAVMSLDPNEWRKFSLRWNLPHPPMGWDQPDPILGAMHSCRLVMDNVPMEAKQQSARYCTVNNIPLPPGVTFDGDVLTGVVNVDHSKL